MSDEFATHYSIDITCTRVPQALEGVPLSIEIVSAAGTTQWAVLRLRENELITKPVKGPGRYLVRAELPSGDWLMEAATVLESPEGEGSGWGEARLDFGVEEETRGTPSGERSLFAQAGQAGFLPTFSERLPSRFATAEAADVPIAPALTLSYGMFRRWNATPMTNTVTLRRVGSDSTGLPEFSTLPCNITPKQHPGQASDSRNWRPVLVLVESVATDAESALIVWPPLSGPHPLTLLLDPDTGENPDAPRLIALSESGNRTVDALFSFVRGGALDAAREAAPIMITQAEDFLAAKVSNPLHATIAAYTLLKIGHAERVDWIANLADWFRYLPDGAILHGWCLIRAGQANQARKYFKTALERGVPMYSEGVRLLRDGLNFLHGLYPTDAQVQADAMRAYRIAAVANFDSELTCLRLGKGVDARFEVLTPGLDFLRRRP